MSSSSGSRTPNRSTWRPNARNQTTHQSGAGDGFLAVMLGRQVVRIDVKGFVDIGAVDRGCETLRSNTIDCSSMPRERLTIVFLQARSPKGWRREWDCCDAATARTVPAYCRPLFATGRINRVTDPTSHNDDDFACPGARDPPCAGPRIRQDWRDGRPDEPSLRRKP